MQDKKKLSPAEIFAISWSTVTYIKTLYLFNELS